MIFGNIRSNVGTLSKQMDHHILTQKVNKKGEIKTKKLRYDHILTLCFEISPTFNIGNNASMCGIYKIVPEKKEKICL